MKQLKFDGFKVKVDKQLQRADIILSRPPLNVVLYSQREIMAKQFIELDNNNDVRVIVLRAEGENFSSGGNIAGFLEETPEDLSMLAQNVMMPEKIKKPVIAAINGYALGGGLELALSAHIRVASKNAKLGLPEVSLGVIPGYGGTQRLTNLVGKGRAMEYILTAKMIGVEDAKHSGLINEYCELEDLLPTCENIARKIIKNSPRAISRAIKCINASLKNESGFETEIEEFGKCFQTDDFIEGTTAFLEKRKPKYN